MWWVRFNDRSNTPWMHDLIEYLMAGAALATLISAQQLACHANSSRNNFSLISHPLDSTHEHSFFMHRKLLPIHFG